MNQPQDLARTVLYLDIGTVNTRVSLFDYRDQSYLFIGAASAATSGGDSNYSIYSGVVDAVRKLERATKRRFLDQNSNFVIPMKLGITGVDQIGFSYTCTSDPRIALMGLTRTGSLQNLRNLLANTGIRPVVEICAADGLDISENIDRLLNADPRIVILAGGTEIGAEKAVYRLGEILMLACKSLTREQRPEILFMGSALAGQQMERVFSKISDFSYAPNVLEIGSIGHSSLDSLLSVMNRNAEKQVLGLKDLVERSKTTGVPGEFAFGRSVRLMSRLIKENQHVLGIDIGSDHTVVAKAKNLDLSLEVLPLGMGKRITELLNNFELSELQSWIGFQIKESEVQDYICNKSVYPDLVPGNQYSAQIEQALTRFVLKKCAKEAGMNSILRDGSLGMVLLCGSVVRNVEDPGDSLLIGMDGLHPFGAVDYFLDMNGLTSAVGALAQLNPILISHIMNASTFLNLGKVITPYFNQKNSKIQDGKKFMSVAVRDDAGNVRKFDVPRGRIYRIPLDFGKNYELDFLKIPKEVSIPGVRTWTPLGFKSGCFGIVFDTRGDALELPKDRTSQISKLKFWKDELGPWTIQPS
ncbi:glutamate mutase L [Flexilinea flocculi]|uniref:MutL protein n=1 Tax=Flexilinea flocculi TaxID=1678840 RepID=A0A0K8P9Q7_9CHLR|nr:glutamate mutase L [Flexilinea flocculi]GAP39366.1 MutL protein [Flexilinea flocculi]